MSIPPPNSHAPQGESPQQAPYGAQPAATSAKNNTWKWIAGGCGCLLLLAIAVVALLIGLGLFGFFGGDEEPPTTAPSPSPTTPSSSPTTPSSSPTTTGGTTPSESPSSSPTTTGGTTPSESPSSSPDEDAVSKPSREEYVAGYREYLKQENGLTDEELDSITGDQYFTCITDRSYDEMSPQGARAVADGKPYEISDALDLYTLSSAVADCNEEHPAG